MKIRRFVYIATIISIGMGIIGTSQVRATFPGNNGKIAFTRVVGESSGVWTVNVKNGRQQIKGKGAQPVWSPSGKRLAFIGLDNYLWIMNKEGGYKYQLTEKSGYKDSMPVWAHDGEKLAFVREEIASGRSAIMTVRIDGSKEINISGWGKFRSPSWAPDGDELVYENYARAEFALIVKSTKTNEERQLTTLSENIDSKVSWSPNGKKILYNDSSNEVYTIWPDGSHRTVISDGDSYAASWSPDGNRIAFIEDPEDDHISISEKDGTVMWIPVKKKEYHTIGAPLWSPDGTALLFTMSRQDIGDSKTATFLLQLDGSKLTKVTDGELREASWQAK